MAACTACTRWQVTSTRNACQPRACRVSKGRVWRDGFWNFIRRRALELTSLFPIDVTNLYTELNSVWQRWIWKRKFALTLLETREIFIGRGEGKLRNLSLFLSLSASVLSVLITFDRFHFYSTRSVGYRGNFLNAIKLLVFRVHRRKIQCREFDKKKKKKSKFSLLRNRWQRLSEDRNS